MALHVTASAIAKKLHQLLIYYDGALIGEYERSQQADIARKKKEVANAESVLLAIYKKHGQFVVRWNSTAQKKSIRVDGIEVGVVPKSAWETPSWRR